GGDAVGGQAPQREAIAQALGFLRLGVDEEPEHVVVNDPGAGVEVSVEATLVVHAESAGSFPCGVPAVPASRLAHRPEEGNPVKSRIERREVTDADRGGLRTPRQVSGSSG